jgi:hypothetical protein
VKISKIILYEEPTVPEIQIEKIKKFITDTFQIETEVKENFFRTMEDKILEKIATIRIFDLKKQFKKHNPTQEEYLIEKENIDMSEKDIVPLYDGFELQNIISENISITYNELHVIFTNKLTVTFDNDDFRYHARATINSNPTIISTTGIIEAPAKPKQYYLDLMTSFSEDKIKEIKEKHKGGFLEYHDSRLNEIIEGYLLQAIVYYETGEVFCKYRECRLFNAHWQKDLFYSQIESKKICDRHLQIISKFRN